jgi:hypothetical protein
LLAAPAVMASLAAAARREALGRFGLRQHADTIMRLYDAMLSAGPAGADPIARTDGPPSPDQHGGAPEDAAAAPRSLQVIR